MAAECARVAKSALAPAAAATATCTAFFSGISLKSLELYALVFITRYLDVFTNTTSLYNTVFKIFYLTASIGLVYAIRKKEPFKSTYLFERDSFLHVKFAIVPCAVIALVINEIRWSTYSPWIIFREVRPTGSVARARTTPAPVRSTCGHSRCSWRPLPFSRSWCC